MRLHRFVILILITCSLLTSCKFYEKVDQRTMPDTAKAKARKNVEEGRGVGISSILKRGGGGNFEFSSSNPLWRATLETLDFLPLSTVDYSGGMVISDWYSDEVNRNRSLKITIRFLSNEITSTSLKIIIHQKSCIAVDSCKTTVLENSKIKTELNSVILKKAALFEKENKKKN